MEEKVEFQVGDKVKLKSGGPEMVIEDISGIHVKCVWFTKNHTPKDKIYLNTSLVKAQPHPNAFVSA